MKVTRREFGELAGSAIVSFILPPSIPQSTASDVQKAKTVEDRKVALDTLLQDKIDEIQKEHGIEVEIAKSSEKFTTVDAWTFHYGPLGDSLFAIEAVSDLERTLKKYPSEQRNLGVPLSTFVKKVTIVSDYVATHGKCRPVRIEGTAAAGHVHIAVNRHRDVMEPWFTNLWRGEANVTTEKELMLPEYALDHEFAHVIFSEVSEESWLSRVSSEASRISGKQVKYQPQYLRRSSVCAYEAQNESASRPPGFVYSAGLSSYEEDIAEIAEQLFHDVITGKELMDNLILRAKINVMAKLYNEKLNFPLDYFAHARQLLVDEK